VSILSPERTVTRTRPVQIAESVVTALSDHVYRADRERALRDAIERCAQHPRSVHRRERRFSLQTNETSERSAVAA
jgi:Leu/Phe-tRNA-protein transferase